MGWIDANNREERLDVLKQIGFIAVWAWGFFFLGTWLAIWFFWQTSKYWLEIGSDGLAEERNGFVFSYAAYAIIPTLVFAFWRGSVALGKQTKKAYDDLEKKRLADEAAHAARKLDLIKPQRRAGFDGVALGISTGTLDSRGHYSGIKSGRLLRLQPSDVCKNIVIFGGIGGGKTTRSISPFLQQILGQDCSALVFDIKGDFRRELDHIAGQVGRSYKVVGDGGLTLNLFRGCTPEVAASYLKSCFIAGGSANGDGAFWAETATNYCRNLLTLIKLAGGDYSIAGLADLVFSEPRRMEALKAVREREQSGQLDAREVRIWNAVLGYMVDTVAKWEDKFRGNVQGTCEAVLNPFVSPDLVDAFSVEAEHGEADLYDLLNEPTVFLVNLPRHKFGAQGARFAYLLIKLRFFTMMSERRARFDVNQDRYVAFLCDEYQVIVDSISDTDFWDKSRSSKCFGVVSMQGYSSLVQSVGNPKTADAILQNWRQRLVFRTEDSGTIDMVQRLLGQVDVHMVSESVNNSLTEGVSFSDSYGGNGGSSSMSRSISVTQSQGESISIQKQHLWDANDFRALDANFVMFCGNLGDRAADDVLEVEALYVPETPKVTA